MRDPRMARRASQAPRMSLVWTSINLESINTSAVGDDCDENMDDQDNIKRGSLRDFCCNHVKSIATIVMVFGMIFCVVMIVMVHKWNYEKNEAKYISACHDIAIIGGGISGTYAAWKLRHSDKDIHLYEMSDRIGGMFHTMHRDTEFPDLYLELGVTSFVPERQPLLNRTIHAMRQAPPMSRPPSRAPPTFFLRGSHLTINELADNSNGPYRMGWREKFKTPSQLQRYLMTEALADDHNNNNTNDLHLRTKDEMHLFHQGFQHVMGKVATHEAMSFLHDTARWRHLVSNDNAALLLPLAAHVEAGEELTVEGGLESIPVLLLDEFLAKSKHGRSMRRRLACIRKKHGVYQLIFIKTARHNDHMKDVRDKEEVCAHQVILAIPPAAVKHLEWKPYDQTPVYQQHIDSVQSYPVLRVFFIYSSPFWPENEAPPFTDVYTDLPVHHVKYLGDYYNAQRVKHYVFMTAEVDSGDLPYLQNLLHMRIFNGDAVYYCNKTEHLVAEITRHIATLYNKNPSEIPVPHDVIIQDWSHDQSTGSWYVWKRGVFWDKIANNMTKPVEKEDVFLVGSGFCGGYCQLNVEGALQTVDQVLDAYFAAEI